MSVGLGSPPAPSLVGGRLYVPKLPQNSQRSDRVWRVDAVSGVGVGCTPATLRPRQAQPQCPPGGTGDCSGLSDSRGFHGERS